MCNVMLGYFTYLVKSTPPFLAKKIWKKEGIKSENMLKLINKENLFHHPSL